MKKAIIIALALCVVMGSALDGRAHSRKGLVKTTLYSDQLTVDQAAYYLEGKVNQRLDDQGRKYRYAIWDFDRIESKGNLALVHVQVNDQKTTERTPEVLYLKRNNDGSWNHVDEDGNVITAGIYTMVKPDYTSYIIMGGSALLLCLVLAYMIVKRKKRKAAQAA